MKDFRSIEEQHGVEEPGYEPPTSPHRWHDNWTVRLGIVALLVIIGIAWHAGTFDHLLYNVGLNAKPCARNGFGAVFCGKELEERRQQAEEIREHVTTVEHESSEAAAKIKREAEEEQAQLRKQSEEADRQYSPVEGG